MQENILQTESWALFQEALGKKVLRIEGPGYRGVGIVESSTLGDSLYLPYGPVAENVEALSRALKDLSQKATNMGLSYVRVEPVSLELGILGQSVLGSLGLVRSPHDVQPKDSLVIDVTRGEKEILASMRSSNRNVFRNIHKKGVTIRTSQEPQDLEILTDLLGKTAERGEFTAHTGAYLRTAAETLMPRDAASLYIAELSTDKDAPAVPIAAALTYDTPGTRVYAHAAALDEHRKLSAGAALLARLILDAGKRGQKKVDLWGIAPANEPQHPWAGFSSFKRSFGGEEVHYPGSWDLPLGRSYLLYRGARQARGVARTHLIPALRRASQTIATLPGKLRR